MQWTTFFQLNHFVKKIKEKQNSKLPNNWTMVKKARLTRIQPIIIQKTSMTEAGLVASRLVIGCGRWRRDEELPACRWVWEVEAGLIASRLLIGYGGWVMKGPRSASILVAIELYKKQRPHRWSNVIKWWPVWFGRRIAGREWPPFQLLSEGVSDRH